MIKRLIFFLLLATVLIGGIIYSKLRPQPDVVSGFIEADEIRVGSRIGGRVAAVHIGEGDHVTASQLLVELEPFDLLERKQEAEATLNSRQAELDRMMHGYREEEVAQAKSIYEQRVAEYNKMKNGPRPQEIEVAKARRIVAEAELTLARQNHTRLLRLYEKSAATAEAIDQAGERLQAATAQVALREQELDLLESGTRQEDLDQALARRQEALAAWQLTQHGYRVEEIAAAEAARDAARYAVDAVTQQMKELKINSPVDGTVEAMELQQGDLVAPSAPVLSLLDDRNLWVRAYVPQNRLDIHVGQQVTVTVDSFPKQPFQGRITFISRQAEFTPSNVQTPEERSKQVFRIKVSVENRDGKLLTGMSADVWFDPAEVPQ